MGRKPSAAASAVATTSALPGIDTTTANVAATAPMPVESETTSESSRFGMPHAVVIIACIGTAAFLAPSDMNVQDVLLLLAGAGAIGAAVVVMVMTGGRRAGRISRMVRAYFSAAN
ncbi:hypothetical protein ACISU4_01165 [Streptomyces wuyuanensis]|uniref:hypothetical protein n=1 Tax=Streptomyces wuyuanensis TaxID=1196353 RepID=UPI00341AFFA2